MSQNANNNVTSQSVSENSVSFDSLPLDSYIPGSTNTFSWGLWAPESYTLTYNDEPLDNSRSFGYSYAPHVYYDAASAIAQAALYSEPARFEIVFSQVPSEANGILNVMKETSWIDVDFNA
ncbi:hypothetical protein C9986_02395, partial [Pseudidiomarina aestuarii]